MNCIVRGLEVQSIITEHYQYLFGIRVITAPGQVAFWFSHDCPNRETPLLRSVKIF